MYVQIGTTDALKTVRDDQGNAQLVEHPGEHVVTLEVTEGVARPEAFNSIVLSLQALIAQGAKPHWVEGDDEDLVTQVAAHFGIKASENKRAKGFGKETNAHLAIRSINTPATLMSLALMHLHALLLFMGTRLMLKTNAGQDFQYNVMASSSSNGTGSYAPANYIALTADATAPAATDTTLTGELTGTLARVQAAVISHTTGTNTFQLQKTFTSDQSVTVKKIGIFNAASGGTMVFESTITDAVLQSGDQLQITETVTM